MNKIIGIYQIVNTINNMRYIGLSRDIEGRLKNHKNALTSNRHENSHLQNSWNKYGEAFFIFESLELVEFEKLNKQETFWIKFYKSNDRNFGFNCNEGGDSTGHSEETKIKIGNSNRGKKRTPEMIESLRIRNTGRKHNTEEIEKQKRNQPKLARSEETKRKISESNKGKKKSECHIKNMSLSHIGKCLGDKNSHAKISNTQALEIFERLSKSQKSGLIAQEMSVSINIVKNIKAGVSWNHITGYIKKG